MTLQTTQPKSGSSRIRTLARSRVARIVAAVLVLLAIVLYFRGGSDEGGTRTTFAARKGPLSISVVEGGNIEALESQTIKSEIKGETKILTIVEEGYLVTQDDVNAGKILVTLDDSQLIEKITQESIEYQSAYANFTDAREQYEIQVKQNESDTTAGELEVKFALMDFKKYMGDQLADQILDDIGLRIDLAALVAETRQATEDRIAAGTIVIVDEDEPSAATIDLDGESEGSDLEGGDLPAESNSPDPEDTTSSSDQPDLEPATVVEPGEDPIMLTSLVRTDRPDVDFSRYASPEKLGDGEAQQKLRKLESDRLISEEELALAEIKLAGTRRLAEKNFVTKQDLDGDEMSVKKNEISVDSAKTAEELFVKYEFPKEAETLLSAYEEAIRNLERTIKKGIATEAQAEARWKSSEANFKLRQARMTELQEQLDACTIPAERTGLVVYAGSDEPWRNREQIEEGATVYERQEIITIPDMTQMAVKVKIHESSIKKIQKGQKARIRLDSYPEQELTGQVIKVNVIPDSTSRWMNPDLKLYPATVSINGTYDWLKPGMSAKVEIEVSQIDDTVYVPIQAIQAERQQRVCYVVSQTTGRTERRVVTTGEFNKEFIAIEKGLEEGEHVLLRAPQGRSPEKDKTDQETQDDKESQEGGEGQGSGRRGEGRGPEAAT
jgi:RND family efflux transporter MFP subunit